MLSLDKHLDNLVSHINKVRDNCFKLGKILIEQGEIEFGISLIERGLKHDLSKFRGIEWKYLHSGNDVAKDKLEMAILQHNTTNDHHIEYWQGLENMPDICIAEMAADWLARSQEFGNDIKDWIMEIAVNRYKMDVNSDNYKLLIKYIELLTESTFVKEREDELCTM